jgi:predicted enzyme related to lactoylglutathione lyase
MGHPHGLFSWCDVAVPDTDKGAGFYSQLFGWDFEHQMDPDSGSYVYTMFTKDGAAVAGMGKLSEEMQNQGIPPVWSSYVSVDDVDVVIEKVTANGGSVMMPAMDIFDSGRMAFVADPQGAALGLWQAGTHEGGGKFNDPGFMTWNELNSRERDAGKDFWAKVLPWTYESIEIPSGEYTMIVLESKPQGPPYQKDHYNGGMMQMDENFPPDLPSHWTVYFSTDDTDATAARVKDLGGTVIREPFDTDAGKIGVFTDDQGAVFLAIAVIPQ